MSPATIKWRPTSVLAACFCRTHFQVQLTPDRKLQVVLAALGNTPFTACRIQIPHVVTPLFLAQLAHFYIE
jgi:hypothetical protein